MRSKWLNLLSQLLHRINVASHAALHRQAMRSKASHASLDTAEADAKGVLDHVVWHILQRMYHRELFRSSMQLAVSILRHCAGDPAQNLPQHSMHWHSSYFNR